MVVVFVVYLFCLLYVFICGRHVFLCLSSLNYLCVACLVCLLFSLRPHRRASTATTVTSTVDKTFYFLGAVRFFTFGNRVNHPAQLLYAELGGEGVLVHSCAVSELKPIEREEVLSEQLKKILVCKLNEFEKQFREEDLPQV